MCPRVYRCADKHAIVSLCAIHCRNAAGGNDCDALVQSFAIICVATSVDVTRRNMGPYC